MMDSFPRFLALAEEKFGPMTSKTANACIRYTPERVAAVLDSAQAGRTAQDVLGYGGDIPVVADFAAGLERRPTALLIGIAPQGGQLPPAWRAAVRQSLEHGMDVWSGLHFFLAEDAEFREIARRTGATIHDFRRPPADIPVGSGRVRDVDATVVLTVGTDCNIGKMTAQLEVLGGLNARGHRTNFAATGQTGILIAGRGIAVDAVVADFIAGAAEQLTIEAAVDADIVLVEGQGSLVHPGYSGVTLGLMHGSLPHAMVLCAQPSRETIMNNPWLSVPSLGDMIELHERVMAPLRPAPVIALVLNTVDMSESDARRAVVRSEEETGLPATDPVRFDPAPVTEAIEAFHQARIGQAAAGRGGLA